MTPPKAKGDRAEREIAALLADQLGTPVRRKLGAGRQDDQGDIDGLNGCVIEVKNYADITRAVRDGLADADREQMNAAAPYAVAFIRRPGGKWFAAMTIDNWCAMWREATA